MSNKIYLPMRGNVRRRLKIVGLVAVIQTMDCNRDRILSPGERASAPKWIDQGVIRNFDHALLLEEMLHRVGILERDGTPTAKIFKIKTSSYGYNALIKAPH